MRWRRIGNGSEEAGSCGTCGLYQMGAVYDRLGIADSALMAYQQAIDIPTLDGRVFNESYRLASTYKRLGELYEGKGDRKKAAEYYGKFVELWKDADPELCSRRSRMSGDDSRVLPRSPGPDRASRPFRP